MRYEYAHYVLNRTLLPDIVSSAQGAALHESLGDTFAAVLDAERAAVRDAWRAVGVLQPTG